MSLTPDSRFSPFSEGNADEHEKDRPCSRTQKKEATDGGLS
jgi:hypothetical protein